WVLVVRLAPASPWSILGIERNNGSRPSASSAPPAAEACGDWRSASTSCAVGFVRAYFDDLSQGHCGAAMARWRSPSAARRAKCEQASSRFELQDVSLVRLQGSSPDVVVKTLEYDKQRGGLVTCWVLTVSLDTASPWVIRDLKGSKCP